MSDPSGTNTCQAWCHRLFIHQQTPLLAFMVQVLLFNAWLPASSGLPISAQFQCVGQRFVGVPMLTESKTAVLTVPLLCDVIATPARIVPVIVNVMLDLGMAVQVVPSAEV